MHNLRTVTSSRSSTTQANPLAESHKSEKRSL